MAIPHIAQSQPQTTATQTQQVDFYFDVSCPWAWRTSLWIREVEKVRPIQVTWKFLSLAKITDSTGFCGGQKQCRAKSLKIKSGNVLPQRHHKICG